MKNKNIIGVIGGMGPQASSEFYRLLIARAHEAYGANDNSDYPEIVLDSVPVPDFLSDTKRTEEAAQMLEDRVERLTKHGVTMITMSCNTACILKDRLQKKTAVPIISIVDEVVKQVAKEKTSVLLLASPTSLRLGLYQKFLERNRVSYVVPTVRDYLELEYIIRSVINGGDRKILMDKLVKLTERYTKNGSVDGVLLGCTELPLVFPATYRLPVYSSLSILAESILKRYYTKEARQSFP